MQSIDFFKKIVRLKFLLALSAVVGCWQTLIIAGVHIQASLLFFIFVFSATLAVYNVRQLSFNFSDGLKTSSLKFVNRNVTKEFIWIFSSLACVLLFFFLARKTQLIILISSLAALFYIMPFRTNEHRVKGIRNIYILKNIWLALTWSLITVVLPLTETGNSFFQTEHILIFFSRFLFIYSIALLFDIRDALHDTNGHVFTIATQNGILFTKVLAFISIALFCILVIIRIYLHPGLILLAPAFYVSTGLMVILIVTAKPGQNFWFYEVLMDSVLIIQAVLILCTGVIIS